MRSSFVVVNPGAPTSPRRSVPGRLDAHALAVLHRPQEPQAQAKAIRDYVAAGGSHLDIARALGIAPAGLQAVLELGDGQSPATPQHRVPGQRG